MTGPACSRSPTRTGPAQILAAAGWRDIEITAEHGSILVGGGGSIEDAVEFLRTGSMGRMMLAGADAGTFDRALASVRAALAPYADAEACAWARRYGSSKPRPHNPLTCFKWLYSSATSWVR